MRPARVGSLDQRELRALVSDSVPPLLRWSCRLRERAMSVSLSAFGAAVRLGLTAPVPACPHTAAGCAAVKDPSGCGPSGTRAWLAASDGPTRAHMCGSTAWIEAGLTTPKSEEMWCNNDDAYCAVSVTLNMVGLR